MFRRRPLIRKVALATVVALVGAEFLWLGVAWASTVSGVTFTFTAPTSVVANTASTWTVGFTTSSTGGLASGNTVTVTFPSGFTTANTTPSVSLVSPSGFASSCAATGQDATMLNVVTVMLANGTGTCALSASTAATLTISVINGAAAAYGPANFSVATSKDTTAAAPSTGQTLTPTTVSSVSVTDTAPTSLVDLAASTWTWGFTTSTTGALASGGTITLTFPSGFTTLTTTPTVALVSPSSFVTTCKATGSDLNETGVVVITLANNGLNTCALASSTSATVAVTVVNGTTDVLSTFSVTTSKDATAVNPSGTAPTLTSATAATSVTFTTTSPTSLVANTASTWTVGFMTSSGGALRATSYVVVQLPTGFTTSSTTPGVTLLSPGSLTTSCTASASDPTKGDTVVITLANKGANTCALGASIAATLSMAVVNGPAATYGAATYALWTSADGTSVSPGSGSETVVTMGPPGQSTNWSSSLASSSGEAQGGAAPGSPSSPKGGAIGGFMCASSSSEVVDLTWTSVLHATSYVIEQSTTASGTYSPVSPAPVFIGTAATITYTTAVTQYYKIVAQVGSAWTSSVSTNAKNGSVTLGFVVTSTSSPQCTNN